MLSALCIRRPVMTILVMVSFVIAGLFGYKQLPVAAVPRVDFPTIQVTAQLPGASPETMASSVASILERQFSTIAGVTTMTSTSSLGNTSIVAAVRPQPRHRRRGARRAVGDLLGAAPPAARDADAAQLPQGQPGRLADHVPGAELDAGAAVRHRRLRQSRDPAAHLDPAGRRAGADLRHPEICRARARRPRPARRARADAARSCRPPSSTPTRTKPVGAIADERQNLDPRRHRADHQGGRLHAGDRDLAERRAGAHLRRRHGDRQRRERQDRELARTARAPSCSPSSASPTPTPSRWSTRSRRCCRRSRPSCRPASTSRC